MAGKRKIHFEKSLDQLEQLVEQLESGDLTLEESLKAFESGIKLSRECQTALSNAEQKVRQLIEDNGGSQWQAFQMDGQDASELDDVDGSAL